ncbi:YqeG family HAD IIIA-type phosphatase [Prochlorococcus sp. MIT 1341]|uniref:YqeG family HAD IIIA-type phosphatase n=1 Tax=Prochlorococcus sp. MIT 1341 TaxID=3096221 RepID=UPI002A74B3AA|nr:YqeG family HAD IIIA-type phosphatase [Prochlorococcus sp. MIT 1341]
MSQNWLQPDWNPGLTVPSLPIEHFLQKGIKALVLDVDGTLITGRGIVVHDSVRKWVFETKKYLQIHLLSNNPSVKRIGSVASHLELKFTCGAAKPRKKALLKVMSQLQASPSNTAIVGDRLFTDILVGNRIGLYTVLVKPLQTNGYPNENNKIQFLEQSIANLIGRIKQ